MPESNTSPRDRTAERTPAASGARPRRRGLSSARPRRTAAFVATFGSLALALGIGATIPAGAQNGPEAPNGDSVILDRPQRVADVAHSAPGLLRVAAERNRMSRPKLIETGQTDRSAWLDRHGRLFFIEEDTTPASTLSPTATTAAAAAAVDPNQTFSLHSKPGSSRTIYLDFKGATVSGTAWNANRNNGAPFTVAPFDLDGVPSSLSAAEHQAIQDAWQLVSEDYAPFDVDVTTAATAADAIERTTSSDLTFGTRVLITGRDNVIYTGCTCGGIAYVGVFDSAGTTHDYYQPSFVFASTSATGKSVAEAASHEVGHNLGLSHDAVPGAGYYSGHASWAPIMGVGYDRPVSQWSKGEYAGATNSEDDLAVMQLNGVALLADDAGDTLAAAVGLTGPSLSRSGLISTRTDVDIYRFSAAAGALSISVTPPNVGGDLDIKAQLLDTAGAVISESDPGVGTVSKLDASGLGATIGTTVSAGTYYLRVDGVGFGNPLDTGYSDYGSIGRYRISGSVPAIVTNQPPVAAITVDRTTGAAPLTVSFSSSGSRDPDGTIVSYAWNFGDGTSSALPAPVKTYGSPGNFTARLTVTDNGAATGSATTTIAVSAPTTTVMHVQALTLTPTRGFNRLSAKATVVITDANGARVPGAVVSGTWSGNVSGTASATTNSNGEAVISSASIRSTTGSFTFTVSNVTKANSTYNAAANVVTARTVTV